jgi:hypothetical protein
MIIEYRKISLENLKFLGGISFACKEISEGAKREWEAIKSELKDREQNSIPSGSETELAN